MPLQCLRTADIRAGFVSKNVSCKPPISPHAVLHFRRARTAVQSARNADDGDPVALGDWREFRAKLVSQTSTVGPWTSRASEENQKLLQIQNPSLAAESVWAHATAKPETGGLLVASSDAHQLLKDDKCWQAVVLVVQHTEKATVGLILNRPTGLVLGRKGRTGSPMPLSVQGAGDLQEVFAENRMYCGGNRAQEMLHIMHGHGQLSKAVQVIPGVFLGGEQAAAKAAAAGELPASDFKFLSGCLYWKPEQLSAEIKAGAWYSAACCRSLILKQCLQLPRPLWREVMELMGAEYQEEARRAYQGEESE